MGLCIDPDENPQGVRVEIRRESVKIYEPTDSSRDIGPEEWVEIDKGYLSRLVAFFNANPQHLTRLAADKKESEG